METVKENSPKNTRQRENEQDTREDKSWTEKKEEKSPHSMGASKVGIKTPVGKKEPWVLVLACWPVATFDTPLKDGTSASESAPFFRPCLPHPLSYCSGIIIESLPDWGFMSPGKA